MSFDKPTRNRLAKFVADARGVIADEFTEQFQSLYGISAKGDITPLEKLGHLDEAGLATASLLRERIEYLEKTHPDDKDGTKAAVARLAREQAFTILNRLAAIRMAEKRGLIVESVGQGYQSKGFKVFETVAGSALGDIYHRYRRFLFCLFDELAIDLGILFDRRSPQALLFPRETALLTLLDHLHASDLERLWAEDETIGWIYQYYNDPEERKKMRKESAAPRNSRELAVRNQFFTPRYVVEFLTDNTLGRIWYEMCQGETRLAEQCRYIVRRPTEIFLAEGETAPETLDQQGLSQEELLRQPVHIPHRPLKDPREIRLLDPACGSMHFGLYAFDLFETIYEEAWDTGSCPALQEAYASKEEFLQDVPRLIIEHNIHGIDIDPRAVQIAGLSLWLRAQKAWQARGVKPADRPRVRRSNIVCAEPMPGSPEMLDEFVATLKPDLLGELVKTVFDKMQLAGEAGSLLKIEEEIRTAIDTARKEWLKQQDDLLTRKDGSKEEFFDTAEQQVIDALRAYAEQADADSYQRRLFADDAARGFAFIDLCRKRYDAVVMNPPFGEASLESRAYLYTAVPSATQDLFAAFVERFGKSLSENGRLGVISNRLALFKDLLDKWRTEVFLGGCCQLKVVSDLGYGVLDDAVVEAAGYVVARTAVTLSLGRCSFLTVLDTEEKETELLATSRCVMSASGTPRFFEHPLSSFKALPNASFAYWCSEAWLSRIADSDSAGELGLVAKKGLETGDDFKYLRLLWEVPIDEIAPLQRWTPFSKGGPYQPTHCDLHLAFDFAKRGQARRTSNDDLYGLPGLTYTERTTSNFAVRILPGKSLFSPAGPVVLVNANACPMGLMGLLNSSVISFYIELFVGGGDTSVPGTAARHFSPSLIENLPIPTDFVALTQKISPHVRSMHEGLRRFRVEEPSPYFLRCPLDGISIRKSVESQFNDYEDRVISALSEFQEIEKIVENAFRLSDHELQEAMRFLGRSWPDGTILDDAKLKDLQKIFSDCAFSELNSEQDGTGAQSRSMTKLSHAIDARYEVGGMILGLSPEAVATERRKHNIIPPSELATAATDLQSYSVGASFGRWDIRYATGERQPPELPDPFDPLPVCPPGMLQNAEGLPAEPKDVPADYPLPISWSGILVDDENHPEDIVARVREAIEVIWKDRAEAIEQEACGILGVKTLRDYFRRPTAFFADHLKRYSKSRRQAPIYWPLSTKSGSYTLWLYYHRLTDQTLHTSLADFLDPKIRKVQSELDSVTNSVVGGTRAGDLREFLDELKDLRDEIERVIKLPWKPNLNDGVLITASPLWKLFRLPKWQKDLKACWDKLAKGEYDWAHLAYSIRPREVEKACEKDRSIAIAHGLEHLCKIEPPKPKKKRAKNTEEQEPDEDEPQLIEEG